MSTTQAHTDSLATWYVIYTHLKQERRVEKNLRAWDIETFNPQVREYYYNQFSGAPIPVTKPLFPRYVFARFDAGAMFQKIHFTRGVNKVVSFGGRAVPVDPEVINIIKSRTDEDGFVSLGEKLQTGEQVIVKDGPFRDLHGIFEHGMKDDERVMLLLTTVS